MRSDVSLRALLAASLLCAAVAALPARAESDGSADLPDPLLVGELTELEGALNVPAARVVVVAGEPSALEDAPAVPVVAPNELTELEGTLHAPASSSVASTVTLFVAVHRTAAERLSDATTRSGKRRTRSLASLIRSRVADDSNFRNRTRFLARRFAEATKTSAELRVATSGEEFLAALIAASRRGPIANLVVYGHAAPTALFMREDIGFYAAVKDVARESQIAYGSEEEKEDQLRLSGARDMGDLERLVASREIRFAPSVSIVFAGCGVAGKREVEPASIAARTAELTGAKVIASVDVTDQSMARGRNFRNHEYSRRTWVRFVGRETPERLNTKVIDALKQLNLGAEFVAAGPAAVNPVSDKLN
jgi:hypothetical protein